MSRQNWIFARVAVKTDCLFVADAVNEKILRIDSRKIIMLTCRIIKSSITVVEKMNRGGKNACVLVTVMLLVGFSESFGVAGGQVFWVKDFQSTEKFIESILSYQEETHRIREDLFVLFAAYPISCAGVEISENMDIHVIMKNGSRILYDDRKKKSFEEKLAAADLQDMLEQKYIPGPITTNPDENYDSGRIRVTSFFHAVYGNTENDVIRNSILMQFLNHYVVFNANEGACDALKKVHRNLSALITENPALSKYVDAAGGTLNWRVIEGTLRISPHAFAIAIDLNPDQGPYWRWEAKGNVENIRNEYPQAIVSIFEAQGFIWGGKWYHYDLMHFEYRPELLSRTPHR